jgi:hypothetical protein
VLLQGGEGVGSLRPSGSMRDQGRKRKRRQTSAAVFWLICIMAGVLIGIIAYLIVSSAVH